MFNNLTSLRFWFGPLVLAGLITLIVIQPLAFLGSRQTAEAAMPFIMFPLALAIGVYMAKPRNGGFFHCPKCGKGIREGRGGTTCHHCGFDTLIAVQEDRERHASKVAAAAVSSADSSIRRFQGGPAVGATATPASAPVQPRPSAGLANPSQTLDLAMPVDVAWERVQAAMNQIGKAKKSADTSRMLVGKARFGLQAVKIKVAVGPGSTSATSVLEIEAAGDDVWGVAERKVTERFLLALG